MFGILQGVRSKFTTKERNSFKPSIESLESRYCPTLHVTLAAQVLPAHEVQLSGAVTGGNVAGVSLSFSGAVTGNVTTDSTGNFSYTTSQATLGSVSVTGTGTDMASANIAVAAPSFSSLSISYGTQRTVTVSGTLVSIDASSRTVSLSGAASASGVTNSSGFFSVTTTATALGMISVSATDLWGQASAPASVMATSTAPVIQNFSGTSGANNIWTFTGNVVDESAPGLTITFGGIGALVGRTTTVQSNGTFFFTIQLPEGASGAASALTTDWWGQNSQTEFYFVS